MSPPANTRGAFIVIEGLDRSGKSTQAARLLDRIQSNTDATNPHPKVVLLKFPDRTTAIGKMIDGYLRSQSELDDHAIHLLFSANRWELAPTIRAHLASGTTVIADRYAFSGIAFSAQKSPHLNLTYEWCKAPEVGLPAPDLTLFLDISPEVAARRGGYGEERYERQEVQTRVRQIFARIGKEMGDGHWRVIDAGQERDEVTDDIWDHVAPLLGCTHTPVASLFEVESKTSLADSV